MINLQKQQYITSDKELIHYFLYDNFLHENTMGDMTKTKKIIEDNMTHFCLDIDKSGTLHIAYLNDDNKLVYLVRNNNEFNKRIICKVQSFYKVKDLKIYTNLNNKNTINVLLLFKDTRNKNTYSLYNYLIKSSNWNCYKVSDICFNNYHPSFKSDIDNDGNLHIIFKTKENDKYKIYYKTYNAKYNTWGLSEKITENKYDLFNILILCDTNDNVNLAWSSLSDKNIKINLIKRRIDLYRKVKWKVSNTLPHNISNLTNPILIQKENNIILGWKQNDFYNFAKTNIDKDDWKMLSSVKLDFRKPLTPITFTGNKYKNISPLKIPNTYLYLSDNESKILGIHEINNYQTKPEKIQKQSIKKEVHKEDIQREFESQASSYLDDISKRIEESSIISDMLSENKSPIEDNELNAFIEKLNNLYKEIESVRNKELSILNSILEMRKNNNRLYKKIEEIIGHYNE